MSVEEWGEESGHGNLNTKFECEIYLKGKCWVGMLQEQELSVTQISGSDHGPDLRAVVEGQQSWGK